MPYFEVDRKWRCITAFDRETFMRLYQVWLRNDGNIYLGSEFGFIGIITEYCDQMPVKLQNHILSMM